MPKKVTDPAAHFWSRVDQSAGPAACWPWLGYVRTDGYGQTRVFGERRTTATHRFAFQLANGWLPTGKGKADLLIRHTCDNRVCCNPEHLEPGTHKDNTADCIARGRWIYPDRPSGLAAYKSKLSRAEVHRARSMANQGAAMKAIAQSLNVHLETARRVVKGERYRDVPIAQAGDVLKALG